MRCPDRDGVVFARSALSCWVAVRFSHGGLAGIPTLQEEPSMSRNQIVRNRHLSFQRQEGRCIYCRVLMWWQDIKSFSARYQISLRAARPLQCTAEHLMPQCDGGGDGADNIAAACHRCNQGRHRRKAVPEPEQFRRVVQRRVRRGRWHDRCVHEAGLIS